MIIVDQPTQAFCDEVSNMAHGLAFNYINFETSQGISISDVEPLELRKRIVKLYGETLDNPPEKIEELLSFYTHLAEIRQLHNEFCIPRRTVREIADSLGISRNGVYERLKRLGLTTGQVANPKFSVLDLVKRSTTLGEKARKIESAIQVKREEEVPLPDLSYLEFL